MKASTSGNRVTADDGSARDELRARLNAETAKIAWPELQRFFAQGHTVFVSPRLDLVDVACEVAADNRECVAAWMANGEVAQVSDAQAQEWIEVNAAMWAVVVRPWVLVQPVTGHEA